MFRIRFCTYNIFFVFFFLIYGILFIFYFVCVRDHVLRQNLKKIKINIDDLPCAGQNYSQDLFVYDQRSISWFQTKKITSLISGFLNLCRYLSQVDSCCSFFPIKYPSVSSARVIASEVKILIHNWIISVDIVSGDIFNWSFLWLGLMVEIAWMLLTNKVCNRHN